MSRAKIAICASGEGSNFESIVEASRNGSLDADVVGLITNRPKIGAIGRAKRLSIPVKILNPKDFSSRIKWDAAMADHLKKWQAEWVVLAGYLALIGPKVLAAYPKRIVNSHPSLLPKYGGPGMYGDRVHEAVVAAREKETGITFHLIDEVYDQGEILHQSKMALLSGESATDLAQRLKLEENRIFPMILQDLINNRR